MKPSQQPNPTHHTSQTLSNDTQPHTNNQQQKERQRVPSGIEDSDDEQEYQRRGSAAVFVDVAVIGELG